MTLVVWDRKSTVPVAKSIATFFGRWRVWKQKIPGDSKCPFHPLVGGHLTPWKGHLTIPKRSLWITRYRNSIFGRFENRVFLPRSKTDLASNCYHFWATCFPGCFGVLWLRLFFVWLSRFVRLKSESDVETYCKGWDWKPENPMNDRKGWEGTLAGMSSGQVHIPSHRVFGIGDMHRPTSRYLENGISPHLQSIVSIIPFYKSCSWPFKGREFHFHPTNWWEICTTWQAVGALFLRQPSCWFEW